MHILGRLVGLLLAVAALIGIVACIAGMWFVRDGVVQMQASADTTLTEVIEALDSAEVTMNTIRDTIGAVGDGIVTVQSGTANVSTAIRSTEPVFNEVSTAFGDTMPTTVETVQDALPNLIQLADTIDQTLQVLSNFDLNETLGGGTLNLPDISILGQRIRIPDVQLPAIPLNFDLGIEYDPNNAFDESLIGLEQNLDGIPETMRTLSGDLTTTQNNVLVIADDVDAIGVDLEAIHQQVTELPAQIDSYNQSIGTVKRSLVGIESQLTQQADQAVFIITLVLGWFAIIQLAPLYLGLELLRGKRGNHA